MSKLSANWPQLRVAIYGVLAAALAGAVIAGVITEDQSAQYAGWITSGLAALGLLLASSNVKTAAPTVDVPAIANQVAVQVHDATVAAQAQAQAWSEQAAPTVAQGRAELERLLGHSL